MTPTTGEREARELLRAEYEAAGRVYLGDAPALRAVVRALTRVPREGAGAVLCRECGDPTMHMGMLCFRCTKASKPQQEAQGAVAFQHKWSDDGETCVHCGDKDWMGDKCSGPRTATQPAPVDVRQELERMTFSRDFYMRRCEALQAVQNKMRDPERKAVCDILANGSTTALDPVDRSHEYAQSKEHGGCSQCGYPEWEPWHRREVGANT